MVYPSLYITMRILFLSRHSDCVFIRLESITSDILEEISSCEMWINSVCLVAALLFLKNRLWLNNDSVIFFTRNFYSNQRLCFATNSISNSFPIACSKDFHKERLLCAILSDWRNFTINLILNSDYGPSDHIISCTDPGSSNSTNKSTNTATVSLPLSLSETIKYVLHTDL